MHAPRALTFALAAAAGLALAGSAMAETMTFRTDLAGSAEVPPTNSAGRGTLTAGYDTTTKLLTWKGEVTGLTGAPSMAHFHGPAKAGENAKVMVPSPIKPGTFEGSATLTDEQASALTAGSTYFNVHTPQFPAGEVRGQVVRVQ